MQVMPRMTALMAGASPLTNPNQGLQEALEWRPLLEDPQQVILPPPPFHLQVVIVIFSKRFVTGCCCVQQRPLLTRGCA